MSALLEQLARDVGAHERTLRRAVADGTIRARRHTVYELELPADEQQYVLTHWGELASLRTGLRTEPSVECAVLFGSAARGDDEPESDLDVLGWMRDGASTKRHAVARRLSSRVGRDVHLTDLSDARAHPSLLLSVLRDGRVLVDRGGRWPELGAQLPGLRRRSHAYRRALAAGADEAREFFAQSNPLT